jgi:hypothetical protein
MSQFQMDLEWPQDRIEPTRYELKYDRFYVYNSGSFDATGPSGSYVMRRVKTENESRATLFKNSFQEGIHLKYYLCEQIQEKTEHVNPVQDKYHHKITLYYLEIPSDIYENQRLYHDIINHAAQVLIESNYTLTTLVVDYCRASPQQIYTIHQHQEEEHWEQTPFVPAKEGHIYL